MSDIKRPDLTILWAAQGDKTAPSPLKMQEGWEVEIPSRQLENWIQHRQDLALAYLLQKGIPEWHEDTEYYPQTSFVQHEGRIYKSLTYNKEREPSQNPRDWELASVVHEDLREGAYRDVSIFGDGLLDNSRVVQNTGSSVFNVMSQKAVTDALSTVIPVGTILPFAASHAPEGFLICDGRAVSRTTYADLFNVIGTTYGGGNGTTTFNLPDLRDEFLRGASPTRPVGTEEGWMTGSHTHTANIGSAGEHAHSITVNAAGGHTHTASASSVANHTHSITVNSAGNHSHSISESVAGAHNHSVTINSAGAHSHSVKESHAGRHTHSITVANAGNHTHSGTTSSAGNHSHTRGNMNITGGAGQVSGAASISGAFIRGGRGGDLGYYRQNRAAYAMTFDASKNWTGRTSTEGNHTHSFTTGSSGNHSHSATASTTGDHVHNVSVDSGGVHTHTGSISSVDGHKHNVSIGDSGAHSHTASSAAAGGHSHSITVQSVGNHSHTATSASTGSHRHDITIHSTGGEETRPRNIAINYIIKI